MDIERGQFSEVKPFAWQTDTAIAKNSWCYTEHNNFKKAKDILCDLVDIVSKNGCLLLNVGPKADGTISKEDTAVLTEIGEWLSINGEAIYGTRTWRVAAEGPTAVEEGQFTDGKDKVCYLLRSNHKPFCRPLPFRHFVKPEHAHLINNPVKFRQM